MSDSQLEDFLLVGGTALALRLGHRMSIDIDLFSNQPFDADQIANHLRLYYNLQLDFIAENTIKGEINNVAVDLIAHQYPWIETPKKVNGIKLAGFLDIAAMKLNAISVDGTRVKDFTDIAFLSSQLSLKQMLEAYKKKYSSNPVMPLKALVYFDDINFNVPIKLSGKRNFDWNKIEKRILDMVENPEKIFEKL